jgi:hypothetical protein
VAKLAINVMQMKASGDFAFSASIAIDGMVQCAYGATEKKAVDALLLGIKWQRVIKTIEVEVPDDFTNGEASAEP